MQDLGMAGTSGITGRGKGPFGLTSGAFLYLNRITDGQETTIFSSIVWNNAYRIYTLIFVRKFWMTEAFSRQISHDFDVALTLVLTSRLRHLSIYVFKVYLARTAAHLKVNLATEWALITWRCIKYVPANSTSADAGYAEILHSCVLKFMICSTLSLQYILPCSAV